jgi:1-acyl-sn-glycerol-3-phosphate acyltransferase
MFGVSSDRFDDMQENVDGYVMLNRGESATHTTQALANALEDRPGIIYPMGTTAAFGLQNFPLQSALFSYLPADIVIIPVAFRGLHSIWPKCPKGNLDINPGKVEAYFAPPMLAETTLMPRRRSLRVQSEAAALFQAVHIASLYDPYREFGEQE